MKTLSKPPKHGYQIPTFLIGFLVLALLFAASMVVLQWAGIPMSIPENLLVGLPVVVFVASGYLLQKQHPNDC